MNDFTLNFPFTKIDKAKRLVTGIATAENLDSDRDIMEIGGSIEAFSNWPGNIREMHQPEAVGKMLDFRAPVPVEHQGKVYDGLEVTVYVSKGAENTWQKVLDGTLRGFSIGGGVIEKSVEYDSKTKEVARRVSKYQLVELSLVDNPANPAALVSMFKMGKGDDGSDELVFSDSDEIIYKSDDIPSELKRLFYCPVDKVASDASTCSRCKSDMVDIGFVEDFNADVMSKMIEKYELSKNGGGFKLQENTSDDTVSNMDELTDDQKENLAHRLVKSLFGKEEKKDEGNISQLPNVIINIDSNLLKSETVEAPVVEETIEKSADEESVEDAADSDDSVEKSAKEVDMAEETVEEAGSETDAIVKALSGVLNDALASFKEEINKTVDEKIDAVTKSVEATSEKVEKLADDGAVSKSEDTLTDEDDTLEKSESIESFWGGRFVPAQLVKALGYDS